MVNNGNLALKYKLVISGIQGDAELNHVIDWTMTLDGAAYALGEEHHLAAKNGETVDADVLTISGKMQESAGNDYMNESIDGIAITVVATQNTVESDSFSNTYDANATYPVVAVGDVNTDGDTVIQDREKDPTVIATIPAGSTDANLEAGKQYTYTITVKKTGLQVESVTASWKDDSAKDGDAEKATFRIHLADFSAPTNTSDYKVTDANGTTLTANDNIYTTSSSAINISLSADDGYTLRKFLTKVTAGICKQKVAYTADTRTYTYTFYDIHSDLWLDNIQAEAGAAGTSPASPNVGDYFYANGTWSSTYSSNTSNPCIGIVFKVGAGAGDNVGNYNFFFMDNTIHGYVVALNDANDNAGAWGIRLTNVDGLTDEGSYVNKYDGYSNTAIVRLLKAYKSTDVNSPTADGQYWAFKVASGYSAISPANTSGWYLPSIGQLNDIYSMNNRTGLFQGAGGTDFKTTDNNGRYWSSTEKNEYDAWYYQFNGSGSGSYAKSDNGYLRVSYVRAILTF